MSDIVLQDIRKSFGAVEVLHGISLSVAAGSLVSLLGPSGCGKTTLLRIVAGLEGVTSGRVLIAGRDVTQMPPERRDIAMMFQSYALLPHLTVSENVRFPLRMRRIGTRDEQAARVAAALETVQLGRLGERLPRQLSGGQQQRVALARAIVSRPKVLLLDEPLSNLDARLREDMQVELIEIHRAIGLTTLFVTHDQEEALSLSDHVVLINKGRIEQQGAPAQVYAHPATGFASSFLGAANLVQAEIIAGEGGAVARIGEGALLPLGRADVALGRATLALRQEDIGIETGAAGGLPARVRTRVYLGDRNRYLVSVAGTTLRVVTGNGVTVPEGATVHLRIAPDQIRIVTDAAD